MTERDNVIWGRFGEQSYEDAPAIETVKRSLSDELLARLELTPQQKDLIKFSKWTTHIWIDMEPLGGVLFNPQSFWFITQPLLSRYATVSHQGSEILIGYLAENSTQESLLLANDLALEVTANFQLDPTDIAFISIDPRPEPHKPDTPPLRPA